MNERGQSWEEYENSAEYKAKHPVSQPRSKRDSLAYAKIEAARAREGDAQPSEHGQVWTDVDDGTLLELLRVKRLSMTEIAAKMGRTYWAVRMRRKILTERSRKDSNN